MHFACFSSSPPLSPLPPKPSRGNPSQTKCPTDAGHQPTAYCQTANSAIFAGGYSYAKKRCVPSIDIFDEQPNRFVHIKARLNYPRDFAQADVLPNQTILISGGYNDIWGSLNIAEIVDPKNGTCRVAKGKMLEHRELFQTATLPDGSILLMGGLSLAARHTVDTAEIIDPTSETFRWTRGKMVQDRFGFASAKLANGEILIVGGTHWDLRTHETKVLDSAEIYDPKSETFSATASDLIFARDRPTANLLPNGNVLIFGGQGQDGKAVSTAELFDPATGRFSEISSPSLAPRMAHNATADAQGRIVITGGWDAAISATTPTSLIYDSSTNSFSPLPNLSFASHDAAQVSFLDGEILVAGGKSVKNGTKANSVSAGAVLVAQHQ